MKGFSSQGIALKVDVLQDQKIHCLQAQHLSARNVTAGAVKGLRERRLRLRRAVC